jgi:hypothetical protein
MLCLLKIFRLLHGVAGVIHLDEGRNFVTLLIFKLEMALICLLVTLRSTACITGIFNFVLENVNNNNNNFRWGPLSPLHGTSLGCGWRDDLQLWKVAATILNNHQWTNDNGRSFSLGAGCGG